MKVMVLNMGLFTIQLEALSENFDDTTRLASGN